MDWSNERYVRVYTRDTETWKLLTWEARALFVLLLRKVDRAGVLETKRGARGVAALVEMPPDLVEPALALLLEEGCVAVHEVGYCVPNYLEAQEAKASDAQRQRMSRERRRLGLGVTRDVESVTSRDTTSQEGAESGQAVTPESESGQKVTPAFLASQPNQPERGAQNGLQSPPPLELSSAPDRPTKRGRTKVSHLARYRDEASRVWDALNESRMAVIPGTRALKPTVDDLERIAERLAEGRTVEDCLHVIRRRAADARGKRADDPAVRYFNGVTTFRKEPFDIALAQPAPRGDASDRHRALLNDIAARDSAAEDDDEGAD